MQTQTRVSYSETSLEGFSLTFEEVEQQTTTAESITAEATTESTTTMEEPTSGKSDSSPSMPVWVIGFGVLFVVAVAGATRLRQDD